MLGIRALDDRRPSVLEFCLNRDGIEWDPDFVEHANLVNPKKDRETSEVLEKSKFRQLHPYVPHPAFDIDIGGKYPVDW